jgi:peroxiredoxin
MRDEYDRFANRDVPILAVGPNEDDLFKRYWSTEHIPFIGLPDPDYSVARLYRQQVNLFKLGRLPLNCVIDSKGYVRYAHYGTSMRDISTNDELLHVIDELNGTSN